MEIWRYVHIKHIRNVEKLIKKSSLLKLKECLSIKYITPIIRQKAKKNQPKNLLCKVILSINIIIFPTKAYKYHIFKTLLFTIKHFKFES